MTPSKPLPLCQLCGKPSHLVPWSTAGHYVRCTGCGLSTSVHPDPADAVAAWEKRLNLPPIPPRIIIDDDMLIGARTFPLKISWDATPKQLSLAATHLSDELRRPAKRTPEQRRRLAKLSADVLAMAAYRLWQ